MITGVPQSLILLSIILFAFILDFVLIRRYERQRQAVGSKQAWGWAYTLLMIGACTVIVLQPVLLPGLGFQTPRTWGLVVQVLGLGLLAGSLALHVWARLHLGQYYAERVEVQAGHRLVDTGPYAFVRHPIIVSFFGLAIGMLLFDPALATLLMAVYAFWDFLRSARHEDELLSSSVAGYQKYMRSTPGFVPKLRKLKDSGHGDRF